MIRKLQRKFILINMTLVCLVLVIVFVSICLFSYHWTKNESYHVMERVLNSQGEKASPPMEIRDKGPRKADPMIPTFGVLVSKNGDILSITKENLTVSDEVIAEVTKRSVDSGEQTGILLDMQLRFLVKETPEGTKIAFADMGREIESMKKLISTLVLVGLGGLTAFFFISLFLSGWILRPTEKAWEQQRQFVADASHELKTPLTVILANIGILLSHPKDTIEQQVKWIENTNAEAVRMKKLVEDLLFLAKSDAAQTEMVVQASLNFSDMVWSCLLPFEPLAYEQGITIDSKITPDIALIGDEGQLKQLLVILLDNACKYASLKSNVTVKMEADLEFIRLSINNLGEPIPPTHISHIFERFYCSDSSRAREQGGYGLGLAIAKTIVSNHMGRISVESNEETGTTFIVVFPRKS